MEEGITHCTARPKSARVPAIIQRKTSIAAAIRHFDLMADEIKSWVEDGKRCMEDAL